MVFRGRTVEKSSRYTIYNSAVKVVPGNTSLTKAVICHFLVRLGEVRLLGTSTDASAAKL